jgi:hypothetical protein
MPSFGWAVFEARDHHYWSAMSVRKREKGSFTWRWN